MDSILVVLSGRFRYFLNITFASTQRAIDRVPDGYYPPLTNATTCILFLPQNGYAAVHSVDGTSGFQPILRSYCGIS